MSQIAAFQPMGQTIALATNAAANTSTQSQINLNGAGVALWANAGVSNKPSQVRIVNNGGSPIFVSFNIAARVAVTPVVGTPSNEMIILPGFDEIFSGIAWALPGVLAAMSALIVSSISPGLAQPFYLTFGEGL